MVFSCLATRMSHCLLRSWSTEKSKLSFAGRLVWNCNDDRWQSKPVLCEPSLLDHANLSVSLSVDNEEVEALPLVVVLSANGSFSRCAEKNCVVRGFPD